MGLSRGSGDATESTSSIPTTHWGSHPPGYRSNSSTLTHLEHEVKLTNYRTLHSISEFASPFWRATFTVDPNDWGFDNVWPAPPKAVEQVWFRDWERWARYWAQKEKREKMGPFARSMSEMAEEYLDDYRKNINTQIYGVDR